jgi:hypothetical protein
VPSSDRSRAAAALDVLPWLIRRPAELATATVVGVLWPIEMATVIMARAVEGEGTGRTWTLRDHTPAQPLPQPRRRSVVGRPVDGTR